MWMTTLISVAVGAWIGWLGFLIAQKKRIDLVHGYHHRRVEAGDKAAYCALMGKALYVIGGGIALSGISALFFDEVVMTVLLFGGILGGLLLMHKAQMKYNGGWFS